MLMSLRAQLQAPAGNRRPIIAAQLNTDNIHDSSRCNVLLWVPKSNGTQFLAGHASGNIIVYKKVWLASDDNSSSSSGGSGGSGSGSSSKGRGSSRQGAAVITTATAASSLQHCGNVHGMPSSRYSRVQQPAAVPRA